MLFLLSETEFAIYADNNTPYVISDNINDVIKILENDSIGLFKWFSKEKVNKDKCHLIVSNSEHVSIKINSIEVESRVHENYLA